MERRGQRRLRSGRARGPAGLGVGLRLAYNSQGSNILERVVGSAYQAQASWVGLGWDLAGIGSISRPLGKTAPYNLSFGGGAFEIKESGGVLTTDPQGFLKIEHSGGLTWNTQPWTVRTPDGTKYIFGNPNGVVGGGTAYEAFWTGWGTDCSVRATQWGLTKIEDPAGNRWDITWAHETKGLNNGCGGDPGQYTRASYPDTLTLTPAGGAATVRVRLVREPRNDKNVCKYNDAYQVNTLRGRPAETGLRGGVHGRRLAVGAALRPGLHLRQHDLELRRGSRLGQPFAADPDHAVRVERHVGAAGVHLRLPGRAATACG